MKKANKTRHGKNVEKLEPSYTAAGNEKNAATLQNSLFLQKLNINGVIGQANPPLRFYPEERKTYIQSKKYKQIFMAVLFIVAKSWKPPKCPSISEWRNKNGMFVQCNAIQQKSGMNIYTDTCYNLDESQNIKLSKRHQMQKTPYYTISFI